MRRKKVKNENNRPETAAGKTTGIQKIKQYVCKNKVLLAIIGCLIVYIFAANGTVSDALNEREALNARIEEQARQYEDLQDVYHDLEVELDHYQDQQNIVDDLEEQLTQLQTGYDSLSVENQSLREENENLSDQISSLQEQSVSANTVSTVSEGSSAGSGGDSGAMVWLSATGSKYHSIPDCGNMNPNKARQVSKSSAEAQGYGACSKCW